MKTKAKSSLTSPSKSGKGHKGKGKGASAAGDSSGSAMDLSDIPLSLPDFADAKDHEQWVPRYHAGQDQCSDESNLLILERTVLNYSLVSNATFYAFIFIMYLLQCCVGRRATA